MFEEIHGKPVKASESFNAARIIGWFDSIEDMRNLSESDKGHGDLHADQSVWQFK